MMSRTVATHLAVGKEADVVAVEGALHKLRHLVEDALLASRGGEHLVELEAMGVPGLLPLDRDTLAVGEVVDGGVPCGAVVGEEGPRADEHADVAPQLLDLVVPARSNELKNSGTAAFLTL